ncbi:hypothetical protein NEHOM01_1365 [Nematocida homosporus]|uniref:uncharacterized protein n=1 Tax=Nematocida homosporus TaxID=1912981 RepID=UPI00221F218E|nr:uncharacterized protein NEHOM01_1365 [Nematocida homosporus]KAI5186276.1 hypothetical protein NEHOM01_1365 [Nematocida homosporus]
MKHSNGMYIVLVNTILLLVVELVAHYKSNAVSILGEAFHMMGDLMAVFLNVSSNWISRRYRGGKQCTFGLERLEVLSAALSLVFLWVPCGSLVYISFKRLWNPEEINREILLSTAGFSCLVNLVNFGVSFWMNRKSNDMNVTSLYLHALTDLIQSVGMCLSALALYINKSWLVVDLICSIVGAALCFVGSIRLVREIVRVLLEVSPVEVDRVTEVILGVPAVASVEDLKIWSLNSRSKLLMSKITLFKGERNDETLLACKEALKRAYGFAYTNIEIIPG